MPASDSLVPIIGNYVDSKVGATAPKERTSCC